MGRLMKDRSGGKMSLQVFHSAQLGEEKDTIEQTKIGALQFNRVNMAPFNGIVPESAVPALPFVFRSTQHMRTAMDGKIGDDILAAFEPHGRSEEHTSELQSLMRNSYAVFCLKTKKE